MKIKIILLFLLFLFFILVYFTLINLGHIVNREESKTGEVIINNKVIIVEIAQTTNQQIQGLGNRDSLAADSGMLFVFPNMTIRYFWMKDMRFPIDIIWIKDDTIVGIEVNAPIMAEKNSNLPVYTSPSEVNYVLEVNAGFCEKNKIGIGDKVIVK